MTSTTDALAKAAKDLEAFAKSFSAYVRAVREHEVAAKPIREKTLRLLAMSQLLRERRTGRAA